jgi:uncharacterized protein YceK
VTSLDPGRRPATAATTREEEPRSMTPIRSTRLRWGRLLLALIVGLTLAGCASDRKTATPRDHARHHHPGPGARRPGSQRRHRLSRGGHQRAPNLRPPS